MTVRKSLAQQEECRVRDTDGDREPGTEAGRRLLKEILGSPNDPAVAAAAHLFRAAIADVEAEAALLARRAPGDRDALAAIVALHGPEHGLGYKADGDYGTIDPACSVCGTTDEYAVPWPCQTVLLARADSRPEQPAPLDAYQQGYDLGYRDAWAGAAHAFVNAVAVAVRPEEPPE